MNEEKLLGAKAYVIYNGRLRIDKICHVRVSVSEEERRVSYQFAHIPGSYLSEDVFLDTNSLIDSARDHVKEGK